MKIDWVAEVFSATRDCGEDISIVYGHGKAGSQSRAEPHWYELQHDQFDGIGGLAHLLRQQGFRVDRLPVLQGDSLTFWRGVRGLLTVLPSLKPRRRQWRRFDSTRKVRFLPVCQRLAWHIFSEEQTRKIVAFAKDAGVTVNTYLLLHLDAVVACQLTPPSTSRHWMVPVNLRGAVTRHAESPPHMSFLGVDFDDPPSLTQLQVRIDGLKKRAYHWGAWLMLHAGKLIGAEAIRRDMRNREKNEHGWTGIFSNLGVWDIPGGGSWIFCPAISRVYPVGAGCITMNGCMALTIQLHEAFGADLAASYSLLEVWRQQCLHERPSRDPSAAALTGGRIHLLST
jgi:hypothetical protein